MASDMMVDMVAYMVVNMEGDKVADIGVGHGGWQGSSSVGHMAWVADGRESRSQAGSTAPKPARRASS